LGVFEAPSSLWEVVEGLAGVDDGQNRHRRRKRLAVWQNWSHEWLDGSGELVRLVDGSGELLLESLELFHICFVSGKVQMKRRKVFQLEKKRILME
jgi:hypothetical protein